MKKPKSEKSASPPSDEVQEELRRVLREQRIEEGHRGPDDGSRERMEVYGY